MGDKTSPTRTPSGSSCARSGISWKPWTVRWTCRQCCGRPLERTKQARQPRVRSPRPSSRRASMLAVRKLPVQLARFSEKRAGRYVPRVDSRDWCDLRVVSATPDLVSALEIVVFQHRLLDAYTSRTQQHDDA